MKSPPLLGLLALGACSPQAAPAPVTPAAASATSAASPRAAFTPEPTLRIEHHVCRAEEPALANALDDDCDGRVDGHTPTGPLLIAIAYAREAPLALSVQDAHATARPLPAAHCEGERGYCTLYIEASALPRGLSSLQARATGPGTRALLISVQTTAQVGAYLASVDGDDREHTLARIELP